jgi:hypothetical protein
MVKRIMMENCPAGAERKIAGVLFKSLTKGTFDIA